MDAVSVDAFNSALGFLSRIVQDEKEARRFLILETQKLFDCGQYGAAWICLIDLICGKLHAMAAHQRIELAHFCAAKYPARMIYVRVGSSSEAATNVMRGECKALMQLRAERCKRLCIVILGIRKGRSSVWTVVDRFLVRAMCMWIWRHRTSPFRLDGGSR